MVNLENRLAPMLGTDPRTSHVRWTKLFDLLCMDLPFPIFAKGKRVVIDGRTSRGWSKLNKSLAI
jgi:hypothetical protein